MSNPFNELKNMYNDMVDENDDKGYSELYKSTFIRIKDFLKDKYNLVIEDVHYLNGYFIFGRGTNSVVHFKLKGAKHWQFGLWWTVIEKENSGPTLNCEIFCQHERYIDKFKPSRSTFCKSVNFRILEDKTINNDDFEYNFNLNEIGQMCKFVRDHLYLAAAKDWHDYDYNLMKQRPVKAFIDYYKDGFDHWFRHAFAHRLDMCMYRRLKRYTKKIFKDYKWEIHDEGEYTSPRYELQVELTDEQIKEQDTGCFDLFVTEEEQDNWNKTEKKLQKIADKLGVCWYNGVSDCVTFWNQKEMDKYWKEEESDELRL